MAKHGELGGLHVDSLQDDWRRDGVLTDILQAAGTVTFTGPDAGRTF
jgi:hypothetical protein